METIWLYDRESNICLTLSSSLNQHFIITMLLYIFLLMFFQLASRSTVQLFPVLLAPLGTGFFKNFYFNTSVRRAVRVI